MEATGKFHRLARRNLNASGFKVANVNPLRSRRFASGRPKAPAHRSLHAGHSAKQHDPDLKIFHDRLIKAGKLAKVAMTAVMRKLLVLANTLVREDRLWQSRAVIAK